MKRVVLTDPRLRYIDSTFGYVSLFPFFVHSLSSNSPKLQKLMTDLRNPQLLWTEFGLRSLSKKSPLYMKRNTEHDPPYWRGPIWVNMNYLALEALNYYSRLPGPFQNQAKDLYQNLRTNLINNIYRQFKKTGYIWEQYNDKTGAGQGSRPFTGWSSLVVLLMAEMY
jgi:mannosyl-oligosaccharide glucosidase